MLLNFALCLTEKQETYCRQADPIIFYELLQIPKKLAILQGGAILLRRHQTVCHTVLPLCGRLQPGTERDGRARQGCMFALLGSFLFLPTRSCAGSYQLISMAFFFLIELGYPPDSVCSLSLVEEAGV
jgi:hypothetical protein